MYPFDFWTVLDFSFFLLLYTQNAKEVLSVRDVVDDAFHNFMPTYQDYVLHKPYEGAENKTYKATTYIIGNLDSMDLDEELGMG